MLRGAARYTGEHAAGAYAARFVRSDLAHARILSIDAGAARSIPGVIAVFTMMDLAGVLPGVPAVIDSITNVDGSTAAARLRPAMAHDRVRFAGEAVALVIAATEAAALDGAEAVNVEYNSLPASCGLTGPLCEDLAFDWAGGDAAAADRAFAGAVHVVTARVPVPRILGFPLEPIGAVASYEAGRWTLVTPSQGVHAIQRELATFYLGVEPGLLRVVTPDVGGGFGIRIHALPEHAALLGAARLLGHPVAWQATRSESNLAEPHARDMLIDAALALDGGGAFLGLRATADCSLGAYVHPGARGTPTASLMFGLHGAYRMPAISLRVKGRYTNTTPTGPFRGAGQPEGTYVLERLIDLAAGQMGADPVALRRRNVLRPGDLPYRCATGHVVDSGDAAGALERAAAWLDACAPGNRPHQGAGLALYMKVNGMGRQERAEVAALASGGIVARIGSQSNGQGHATTFAALTADRLGLTPRDVTVVQGDTDTVAFGTGTGASSALATTGSGIARSCTDLLRRARIEAARHLQAAMETLDYKSGSFRVPGGNRFVMLAQLAEAAGGELTGRSEVPVTLTYTVGCHACRVGVEPETGAARLLGYAAFDDLGPLLQPAIAHGQVHGGVAQGVGQAMMEAMAYDESAQPLTASLLDYCLPRAADLPPLLCEPLQTPGLSGDLQVRGAGEAGAIASMAAVVNAAAAAIGGPVEAPLTPQRVWQAIQTLTSVSLQQSSVPPS